MRVPNEVKRFVESLSADGQEAILYEMMKQGILDTEIEGFEKVRVILQSMINTAMVKEGFWRRASLDVDKLEELSKTEEEAKHLATYYEGVMDGLMDARDEGYKL